MTNATTTYFHPDILNRINRLELRAQHVVEGFLSGLHKSPYKGFSIEFADHREYVPGDDLRHIDWRVYAKSDRFYIKEYEVETNLRTYLLLDASASMAYPDEPAAGGQASGEAALSRRSRRQRSGAQTRMNKWTYAATVAASLAYLLHLQQDGAGLMLFDSEVRGQLPVTTSRAGLNDLVELISRTQPRGDTQTKLLFRYLADRIPNRSMVVVISDLLADPDDIIAGIQQLRFHQHDVIVMHVMDADELEFPFTERVQFDGLEGVDERLRTDPQALRTAYRERVQAFISRLRSACLNNRIDYTLLNTKEPLDIALTRYLAARSHVQRRG